MLVHFHYEPSNFPLHLRHAMKISATLKSAFHTNEIVVSTEGQSKTISIPAKPSGFGSSVNGGELLMLSLAVCCCNDIYREASKRNIHIERIDVEVSSQFGAEGVAGSDMTYKPTIKADIPPDEMDALIKYVDSIAEIHKTLRQGVSIGLITDQVHPE